MTLIIGPRGAVGGCSTPGSRVDPWWSPGSFSPSVSSPPGPHRVDEGPPGTPAAQVHLQQQQHHQHHHHHHHHHHNHHQQHNQHQSHHHPGTPNPGHNNHSNGPSADFQLCQAVGPRQYGGSRNGPEGPGCYGGRPALGYAETTIRSSVDSQDSYELITSSQLPDNFDLSVLTEPPTTIKSAPGARNSNNNNNNNNNNNTTNSNNNVTPSVNNTSHPRDSGNTNNNNVLSALLNAPSPANSSPIPASPDSLNGLLSTYPGPRGIKEESEISQSEQRPIPPSNFGSPLLSNLLAGKGFKRENGCRDPGDEHQNSANPNHQSNNNNHNSLDPLLVSHVKLEYSGESDEELLLKQQQRPAGMKFEAHPGPPSTPHGGPIGVGGSPSEVVDSILLSPWGASGADFLEPDSKQTAASLQDAWDTMLLSSSVGVGATVGGNQSLAELKPLPPFTNYTGHLSINGIPGHHYHTIASSAQRQPLQSPSPSSNHEYYESSVVSSSTPCPQQSQQPKNHHHHHPHPHHNPHQQQQQHHHHHQHHQPPQLPQSTQQTVDYDIEDIAEIIGSAIADTTVPGGNGVVSGSGPNGANGPGSAGPEHDPDASRDWIDIAEWINTACSPKPSIQPAQQPCTATGQPEGPVPAPYPHQLYNAAPGQGHPGHGSSTLQSLLTHGYAPVLQQRLVQNCGETPSSTSPYPPVSPPGRVSTSCSPEHQLHSSSSFAAPQQPRKRSRPSGLSSKKHQQQQQQQQNHQQQQQQQGLASTTTQLAYGAEPGLLAGKEKPVHRCSICNRGFLNKSNIKVHLRTHTGEKPFRCEVCGKAFRQKAHLIKHQQIHKRIGRD